MSDETNSAQIEAATKLIEGAVSLIEMHGWWDGKQDLAEGQTRHCMQTALDAASVFFDAATYQIAFDALYNQIPEAFRMTYACYSPYTVLTMYNDDHDEEHIVALMKAAYAKLKEDHNIVRA